MNMRTLARTHQETCLALADHPTEELLLWYADLALEVDEAAEEVEYHCPKCGQRMNMGLDQFLHLDTRTDMRCKECCGDENERGGDV